MKIKLLLPALACLLLAAGCASKNGTAPAAYYSAAEIDKMTFCTIVADSVRYVASEKMAGRPIDQVRSHYAGREFADVSLAVADRVYSEEFTSIWDYTISYFSECANRLAGIAPERIAHGRACMNAKLIADIAYAYKEAGAPREKAYAHFSRTESDSLRSVIDHVYNSDGTGSKLSRGVWNTCIANATAVSHP